MSEPLGKQNLTPTHSLCLTAWAFGVPTWRKIKSNIMNNKEIKNTTSTQSIKKIEGQITSEILNHFANAYELRKEGICGFIVLSNLEWASRVLAGSFHWADVCHDFIGLAQRDEFFVPKI